MPFRASSKKVKNQEKREKAYLDTTASKKWHVGIWTLINFDIGETIQQVGVALCLYFFQVVWLIYKTTPNS